VAAGKHSRAADVGKKEEELRSTEIPSCCLSFTAECAALSRSFLQAPPPSCYLPLLPVRLFLFLPSSASSLLEVRAPPTRLI
jgi:hypothetical protein